MQSENVRTLARRFRDMMVKAEGPGGLVSYRFPAAPSAGVDPGWLKEVHELARHINLDPDLDPDSWRYLFFYEALSFLADDSDPLSHLDRFCGEIEPDRLIAWLTNDYSLIRLGYVDGSRSVSPPDTALIDVIAAGYKLEKFAVLCRTKQYLLGLACRLETEV